MKPPKTEKKVKKLYIVGPKTGGDGVYSLIADDGEFLASHMCSHAGYAQGDLEGNRPERKQEWKKKYGDYEVIVLGQDEMTRDELLERNTVWFESLPPQKTKKQKS